MPPLSALNRSTTGGDVPASATSQWMTQFRAMFRLRISLFQANVLSLGPFFLQPMIYLSIVYYASHFNTYKVRPQHLSFDGPSQRGAPFYNATSSSRTFIAGTNADPALSLQVFTRINETFTVNRQLAEGNWTTATNPNFWHHANTLAEVSDLTFQFLGSAPIPKLKQGHLPHPELSPPFFGYLLHSFPTTQSPTNPLNLSVVVNINPGYGAVKSSPTMLNVLTDSVQLVLPATFASSVRNSTRNAVDQLAKLHEAQPTQVAPPWTVQLYGGYASFPAPLSESFDLLALAMPPVLVYCIYLMLMGATRNMVAERVEGQFSYFVTNSLRPEMFYISAIAAYSYLACSVVAVMFFPIVNLRWMSTLVALALLVLFCVFMASQAALLSFAFKSKNSVPSILYMFVFFLSVGPQVLNYFYGGWIPYSVDILLTLLFPSYAIIQSFNDMSAAAFNELSYRAFASHFPFALLALASHIAINTLSACYLARRDSRAPAMASSGTSPWLSHKSAPPNVDCDIEAAIVGEANLPTHPQVQAEMDRLRAATDNDGDDESSPDVVRIKGLSMSFRSDRGRGGPARTVLDNLWLSVRKNELFAFLGPNGAGKSTTINILTGLLQASAGSATVCGKSPDDPEIKRMLGVCPQYDQAYSELTVYHHLRAFAYIKGVAHDRIQEAIKLAVEEASLTEYLHRGVGQLSGGTRRRLSIAIACIGRPAVVILDEPTTGVDVATRRTIWDMIAKLKSHTSVLLVTHDMDEAERLAERAGILINGSLVCLGSPHRLKSLLGAAYLLKLQFAAAVEGDMPDRVLDEVEGKCHAMVVGSKVRVVYRGESRIEVAIEKGPTAADQEGVFVGELLTFITRQRRAWQVSDWSLGEVSLGELFVRFARQHRAYQEEEEL